MNNGLSHLDSVAVTNRLRNIEVTAGRVRDVLNRSETIVNDLMVSFQGQSAQTLKNKFDEVAETYKDVMAYFEKKMALMEQMTANITSADESE